MRIYHGSQYIIETPEFGKGKPYNDYGLGFYCTQDIEMAKEWSCDPYHDGFANIYELDLNDLKILNLTDSNYTILHWLTILLKNRTFRITNPIAKDAKEYLINHFSIDTSSYDIIIGYRADDSYFSFAEDFLNNGISINKLEKAMKLGHLGEQIVLISMKAFHHLKFKGVEQASKNKYYILKENRDKKARKEYLSSNRHSYNINELYMIDIMRQEVKEDDLRIR
jgi:hypothetical protein